MRIEAQLSAGKKLRLAKAAFSTDESAAFSYPVEKGLFFAYTGIGLFQLSPMIGKSFLGESLNFLIGKLKMSYRRVFSIIGESLAEVSSGLRRGGLFGIFIAEYAMKSRFFE